MPSIGELERPEFVIALVGAVGTNFDLVVDAIQKSLSDVGYKGQEVHLSNFLKEMEKWKDLPSKGEARYKGLMDAGDKFREITGRGEALALLAISAIREERTTKMGDPSKPISNRVYILRSLKHPDEVKALRRIYHPGFFLIAAFTPREIRLHNLSKEIADSNHVFQADQYRAEAEALMKRDEYEHEKPFGQNVRDTYPLADVFLNTSDIEGLRKSVKRFFELLFNYPFHTPTKDEFGMYHAKAAALRSVALGRQVGAVITTKDGNIIAVGTNEVPRPGGGLYWSDDDTDHRDFRLGYDTNDRIKRDILGDILKRLQDSGWLSPDRKETDINLLLDEAIAKKPASPLKGAQLMNLTEFGRVVHGEMAALTDAAHRGVSVNGCTLYVTTFPCHDCAKHIVAAGIRRVVYIEPYPKSMASDLYLDSIAVDGRSKRNGKHVRFESFVGVDPRRYMDLFEMVSRKTDDGKVVIWDKLKAYPRFTMSAPAYLFGEVRELDKFKAIMVEKGLFEEGKEAQDDA